MDKDRISEAIEQFSVAEDHWSETRNTMREDLKFARLGEQWDEKTAEDRTKAGRPVLTINKLPSFARQVVNEARQNKPSIHINPVDDEADVDTAEVMNGLIRNIEYTSNAEVAYDTALENAVYCGMGFYRIGVDYASYDQFDFDIKIERIANPLSVFPDIGTEACDASDWNRCFVTEMLPDEEFEEKYPGAEKVDFKADYDENWRTEDEVRVAERWQREGVETELLKLSDGTIMLADQYEENQEIFSSAGIEVIQTRPTTAFKVTQEIMTANEILETIEWAGRYIPIIPVYGEEFTVEGRRYFKSMFSDAHDSQRMFNYWRTASTELVALAPKAPYVGMKGQFNSDASNWANANVDNLPYLEYDDVKAAPPPRREPPPQIPAGALQETQSADMDMKSIIGIHEPGLGDIGDSQISGKAVESWRVSSDISNFHFQDNLARSMRYAGRVLLDLIPHVYNEQRVLRVMGWDDSVENVPVMQEYDKDGIMKMHDFSKGKYDLTVTVGASFTTKRKEALDSLMKMVAAAPDLMAVSGDLIAKNMDWDGAEEISKRLKAMLPPEILALENMEGVPEEARPFIINMKKQMDGMEQTLQQKDMVIAEMDQQIKVGTQMLNDKRDETQVKRDKLDVDLRIAQIREQGDQKLALMEAQFKEQLELLRGEIDSVSNLRMM